jgi:hypothetical protein
MSDCKWIASGTLGSDIESVFGVKAFVDNAITTGPLPSPAIPVLLPFEHPVRNNSVNGNYLIDAIGSTKYTSLIYVFIKNNHSVFSQISSSSIEIAPLAR